MAERTRDRLRRAARCLAAAGVGLVAAADAEGFYFVGWPGDGLPRDKTLVPSAAPRAGNPPSAQSQVAGNSDAPRADQPDRDADERQPPPDDRPPDDDWPERPPPTEVTPEPATFVSAGIGLAALGLGVWRRRR
jgi:hypothetical protein